MSNGSEIIMKSMSTMSNHNNSNIIGLGGTTMESTQRSIIQKKSIDLTKQMIK